MQTTTSLPVLSAAMTFEDAATAVLTYLHERMPRGFWSVARVADGQQTHIVLGPNVFGAPQGLSVPWEATICRRMVAGDGPMVAPDISAVPAYAELVGPKALGVTGYAGAPIQEPDGQLFGVLCGMATEPVEGDPEVDEPLLQLLAGLLGMVLAADRARTRLAEEVRVARAHAHTDALTGLLNRRAWDEVLSAAEEAHAKFGDPAAVVLVDLDQLKTINDTRGHAAGDAYIAAAGAVLRATVPSDAPVARLGGDEFGILLSDADSATARAMVETLYAALAEEDVAGSIGWAPYTVIEGFPGAVEAADRAMYAAKRERRTAVAATD